MRFRAYAMYQRAPGVLLVGVARRRWPFPMGDTMPVQRPGPHIDGAPGAGRRTVLLTGASGVVGRALLQRLRDRGFGRIPSRLGMDTLKRESFAVERVHSYLDLLAKPEFAEHIWTDDLSISQVAERAAAACVIDLPQVSESRVRTVLRRTRTTVGLIRL